MKITIEPQYKDYFYPKVSKRPWGYTPYMAGKRRMGVSHLSRYERRSSLKRLLLMLSILLATIVSREALAETSPTSGEMQLIDENGQHLRAIQLESEARININGLHSRVTITQSFTNQTDQWVEGIYVFPLPTNSAVNAMTMIVGERVLKAKIREKEEAKKIYSAAKKSGKKAALFEQERPNIFTQSIANIGPGETVQVTLNYLQPVRYDMGKMSVRFPMTLTKRFIPDADIHSPIVFDLVDSHSEIPIQETYSMDTLDWATDKITDASRITPPQTLHKNQISLSIELDSGIPLSLIESPSHKIEITENADSTYLITTPTSSIPMDRDFELTWHPKASTAPQAAAFHEQMHGESYIQFMLLPPHTKWITPLDEESHEGAPSSKLARELILVIDTSGSMQGQSIVQAKKSVEFALSKLQASDHFNIIAFASSHRALFTEARPADSWNIDTAIKFVNDLNANGGTNMASALEQALNNDSDEERLRQVVFITDGAVGNELSLFQLICKNLQESRLFTVGIGSAPNSHFMEKAAQFGRGTFTQISTASQVDLRMNELFKKLENPVMSDVEIVWPSGWEIDAYPNKIPDLYLGQPIIVTAKVSPEMTGYESVRINGTTVTETWQRELTIPKPKTAYSGKNDAEDTFLKTVIPSQWARLKIDHLLDRRALGDSAETVRSNVLPLALKYQLLSPYTSFIAVESLVSRTHQEPLTQEKIANTRPAGQVLKRVPYPQTATSAKISALTGLMTLLLAFLVYYTMPKNTLAVLHIKKNCRHLVIR